MRGSIKKVMRQVHLVVGLSLGALFVLLGLTGSILVFYPEIDELLHPEIREKSAAVPDWDRALATLRAAYPTKRGAWRFEVTGNSAAIPARYYNPPETAGQDFAPMMVWLSPDGSYVLRRDYWGDYAMTWIYDLHYRLLLGERAGTLIGYAGIILIILLLSGVWAWWPQGKWVKAFHFKRHAALLRRLRDIHKLSGLVGLPLLLLLTITGVMLALPKQSDAVLAASVGPLTPRPKPTSQTNHGKQISVAAALQVARTTLPQARIAWIEVPGEGNDAFRLRLQQPGDPSRRFPHSFVWIDQYSGAPLAIVDTARDSRSSVINNWVHPLHQGSVGGLAIRLLTALAGLVPLALFMTGWQRWSIRRTRKSGLGQRKIGLNPAF
jgi:uncharacterized iron-regulated membrane protein